MGVVLEAGLRSLPDGGVGRAEGIQLVFRKNKRGNTPYKLACEQHGKEAVHKVLEEALCQQEQQREETLIVEAAVDDCTDLDGVFYFLRRRPDVLREHYPAVS